MILKPKTIDGYGDFDVKAITSTCLYIATMLGDLMDDIVVVGGLVPSLLVDHSQSEIETDAHAGTMDVDLGLSLAIFDEQRYSDLHERLKGANLEHDANDRGNRTSQRWRTTFDPRVTVDFLIPPIASTDLGGRMRNIAEDFGAVTDECLHLAFEDRRKATLSGFTPLGERAEREVWVCGPGAFTVLKAKTFENRGEPKDAYDVSYVWKHLGLDDAVEFLKQRCEDACVQSALGIIHREFTEMDRTGPSRAAAFIHGSRDPVNRDEFDAKQADVVGLARELLTRLGVDPDS